METMNLDQEFGKDSCFTVEILAQIPDFQSRYRLRFMNFQPFFLSFYMMIQLFFFLFIKLNKEIDNLFLNFFLSNFLFNCYHFIKKYYQRIVSTENVGKSYILEFFFKIYFDQSKYIYIYINLLLKKLVKHGRNVGKTLERVKI